MTGVVIANIEHISHLAVVFLLLTLNMQLPFGLKDGLKKNFLKKLKTFTL